MSKGAYLKLGQRQELTPDPPFVGDRLRDILSHVVGNRHALPDAAWFQATSGFLNRAHGWAYQAQEDRKYQRLIARAHKLRTDLAEALEEIREREPMQRLTGFSIGQSRARHLDRSIIAAQSLYIPASAPEPPRGVADWRHYARVLREEIDRGMQAANPDYPVGQAKGLTSEIIAAINRVVLGEQRSPGAIATEFQKTQ